MTVDHPTIAVVIPVFGDVRPLRRVLAALRTQLARSDRIILVDDGSSPDDERAIRDCAADLHGRCTFLRQPHRGPAAARNTALAAATEEVILFLGMDIVPAAALLARHRALHVHYPEESVGCLGHVTWDPALPPTPFMVWLEHGGPQNAYGEIGGARFVDPRRYCYGANLSFKRTILERVGGFDSERFRGYGWEDRDLGIRLHAAGCTLFYEPAARAWHAHAYSLAAYEERQRAAGKSAVTIARRHPDVVPPPPGARRTHQVTRRLMYPRPLRSIARALARRSEWRWILPALYARVTGWAFTEGVRDALRRSTMNVDKSLHKHSTDPLRL